MTVGIYMFTNKINGMSYIGQSTNIERRYKEHMTKNSEKTLFHEDLKKYGKDNFYFKILETCCKNELDNKETYYIKVYNTIFPRGYNKTFGGKGRLNSSVKISQENLIEIYDMLINSEISQNDIAKKFSVGVDTISEINNGKTRVLDGYTYPLRKKSYKEKNFCIDCGKPICRGSKRCVVCKGIRKRKVDRPSKEELKDLIINLSFVKIGEIYGVSDNAVRKWCKSYGLPYTRKCIKSGYNCS